MAANVYEGMFILDSSRFARDHEAVSGQLSKVIQETGGEILVSRLWEERRLAFPIKGQRKGTYWLTYFRLEGEKLGALRQKFQINENVLRMLFVKVDPKIVDTLVAHALAGPAAMAERHAEAARAEADVEVPVGAVIPRRRRRSRRIVSRKNGRLAGALPRLADRLADGDWFMASYNRVILVGNLTRDPEVRYIPSGMAVSDIGIAVSDRRKNASGEWIEETTFVDVTLWGRTAEVASEYLSKGSPIFIEGRLKLDTWEQEGQKRSKMRVVCEKMQMLGGRGGPGEGGAGRGEGGGRGEAAGRGENGGRAPARRAPANQAPPPRDDYDAPAPDAGGDDIPF